VGWRVPGGFGSRPGTLSRVTRKCFNKGCFSFVQGNATSGWIAIPGSHDLRCHYSQGTAKQCSDWPSDSRTQHRSGGPAGDFKRSMPSCFSRRFHGLIFYLGGRAGGGGGTGFAGLGTGLIDGGGRGFNGGGGTGLAGWGTGFAGGAGRALVGGPGNGSRGPNRLVKGGRFVSKRLVNPGMFVPKRLVPGGRTTGARSAAFVTTAAIKVARIVALIFTLSSEHGTCPRFLYQRG
jgi:hypothetical protein